MRYQLKFPKKSDYPNKFKILNHPSRSVEYHQLVEASASAYFETKGPAHWLFMKRFELALKYLAKIKKINHLLDAGTGIGFFLPTLSQCSKKIIALDYAQNTLRYAKLMCRKRKIKNIHFIQGDLLNLKLGKQKFEVITALSVLEHIPPEKLNLLMLSFKRILKPGGYLIAGWPNEGNWLFKLAQQLEKRLIRQKVFKSINDKKAKYIPLGHVSLSTQIETAVFNNFKTINICSLPWNFPSFYHIGQWQKI